MLAQPPGEKKIPTGIVSDVMCAQTHMMKDEPDAECLRYCVKQGNKYALVASDATKQSYSRLFAGQIYDSTGLYYIGVRYYDPAISRFISPDPSFGRMDAPQALNRYSYVRNNPQSRIDSTGMDDSWPSDDDGTQFSWPFG